jgi:hypothetical protein
MKLIVRGENLGRAGVKSIPLSEIQASKAPNCTAQAELR